jgi:hypothetical protein
MAMAMPKIVDTFADSAAAELDRLDVDLDSESPTKRAKSFRVLGTLEEGYLTGMREAVEKRAREN